MNEVDKWIRARDLVISIISEHFPESIMVEETTKLTDIDPLKPPKLLMFMMIKDINPVKLQNGNCIKSISFTYLIGFDYLQPFGAKIIQDMLAATLKKFKDSEANLKEHENRTDRY